MWGCLREVVWIGGGGRCAPRREETAPSGTVSVASANIVIVGVLWPVEGSSRSGRRRKLGQEKGYVVGDRGSSEGGVGCRNCLSLASRWRG